MERKQRTYSLGKTRQNDVLFTTEVFSFLKKKRIKILENSMYKYVCVALELNGINTKERILRSNKEFDYRDGCVYYMGKKLIASEVTFGKCSQTIEYVIYDLKTGESLEKDYIQSKLKFSGAKQDIVEENTQEISEKIVKSEEKSTNNLKTEENKVEKVVEQKPVEAKKVPFKLDNDSFIELVIQYGEQFSETNDYGENEITYKAHYSYIIKESGYDLKKEQLSTMAYNMPTIVKYNDKYYKFLSCDDSSVELFEFVED